MCQSTVAAEQFLTPRRAGHPEPLQTRREWQTVSPNAELMISPDWRARCIVRDTRALGGDRFRWTVAVLGQLDPVAEGWTENRVEACSLAEAVVTAYLANRAEPSGGGSARD